MRANGLFVIEKNWRAHLLMRRKIFRHRRSAALQKILVSPIAIRYSPPFLPFATRYSLLAAVSPFAAVSRLADLPISRFADKIRLGRSLALPNLLLYFVSKRFTAQLRQRFLERRRLERWRSEKCVWE
jgi:hypothetical protein